MLSLCSLCRKNVYSKPHLTNLHLFASSLSSSLSHLRALFSPFPLRAFSTGSISICLVFAFVLFDFYFYILFCFFFLRKSFQLVNRVDFKKSVPSILVLIHFLSFMNACCQLLRYMFRFFFFLVSYLCVSVRVTVCVWVCAD